MGWCYTFGVNCDSGCKHPMLVRETLDACSCEACGASCGGRFANCWRSIFQPNGRAVQMRGLPATLPAAPVRDAEIPMPDTDLIPTATAIADSGESGTPGAFAAPPAIGEDAFFDLEVQVAGMRREVADIAAGLRELAANDGQTRGEIARLAAQLDAVTSRQIAPVNRAFDDPPVAHARPGRAVAHPDVVHRGNSDAKAGRDDHPVTSFPQPIAADGTGGSIP